MAVLLPSIFLLMGYDIALSFFCGAVCAALPQAYFALRMAKAERASAQQAARLGLAAEGGKFLLSAALFAIVFAVVKPAAPGTVFLGFIVLWAIQLVGTVGLLKD